MSIHEDGAPREVHIAADGAQLTGDLVVPPRATGIVVFAHGSGSSRKSPRNRAVARKLQRAGLATLLLDLLTPAEDARERAGATLRFEIEQLARRLLAAVDWIGREDDTRGLPVGLFGASTGAAAALLAAAARPAEIGAVVSRGGRPDLAGESLRKVTSPTRLIVGGGDEIVLELNRLALQDLASDKDLVVVRGATHLFEEPGALEHVTRLAAEWFARHLHVTAPSSRVPDTSSQQPAGSRQDPAARSHARSHPGSHGAPDEQHPEVVPPPREPSIPRPPEVPIHIEPPYTPAPPPSAPRPPAPEVQPFRPGS